VARRLTGLSAILKWTALTLFAVSGLSFVIALIAALDPSLTTAIFVTGLGSGGLALVVAALAIVMTMCAWIARHAPEH
jgi:hypothetical protein